LAISQTEPKRVLFIHGFMGSALNWGSIRTFLEAQRNVKTFAVDLLGHALNHPKTEGPSAHELMVQDLEKQIIPFAPTHVVAHSFGFRPALLLGIKNPALIPFLIVEDTHPELGQTAYDFLMGILNSPVPFRTREEARNYFDEKFGKQTSLSRFLLSNIRSTPDNQATWRFNKPFLAHLLTESLNNPLWREWQQFKGKSSLVYGEKSDAISPETIEKMKSLQPNLTVHKVDNSGHWIHADQPQAFVECLCSIIN
jgi:esterase